MAVTLGKLLRIVLIPLLLAACSVLPEPKPAALDKYLLEYTPATVREPRADAPVLIVATPQANGAYDTARIAYMQQQFGLRYYTRSSWADTPARMLAPLLAEALNASGQFQAMYASPGRVAANLRLDTELLRFHQDFTRQPSEMHITAACTAGRFRFTAGGRDAAVRYPRACRRRRIPTAACWPPTARLHACWKN